MKKERFSPDMPLKNGKRSYWRCPMTTLISPTFPKLDEEFFKNAKLVERKPRTEAISIRIDTDVLQWFKEHAKSKGYQTLINDVLRTYVEHSKGR
jgi:uncharacterized protein (DUF4415 family)